jgi:two-component system, OmpR family, sensor kinase
MFLVTIRAKLVCWFTLVLALILVSFSALLYFTLSRALYDSVDKKLTTIAEITADSSIRTSEDSEGWNDYLEKFFGFRPTAKYIQILDKSGNVDYDADKSLPKRLPLTAETVKRAETGEVVFETLYGLDKYPIRMINYPVVKNDKLISLVQVGSSLEYVEETLRRLSLIIIFTVPTVILFSSVGGYFLAKAALGPVAEITDAARRIGAKDLSQRIPVRNKKDELGRLTATFNEMLERIEKSFAQIRQFSADASHELRTPLTILKGETEWALRTARGVEDYREILTSSLEEINTMSRIVEDLLILSRSDIGETPMEMEPVELSAVVTEVYDMGRTLAEMRKQTVELNVGELNGITIMGNELRLRQLFLNLIDNGVKYTKDGGQIRIDASVRPESVEIRVSDNGVGIAPEDQPKIFDRFFRVDKNRSRKEGGTGLGLAICRFITEAHRGTISVSSTPGMGSTFTVVLPRTAGKA